MDADGENIQCNPTEENGKRNKTDLHWNESKSTMIECAGISNEASENEKKIRRTKSVDSFKMN